MRVFWVGETAWTRVHMSSASMSTFAPCWKLSQPQRAPIGGGPGGGGEGAGGGSGGGGEGGAPGEGGGEGGMKLAVKAAAVTAVWKLADATGSVGSTSAAITAVVVTVIAGAGEPGHAAAAAVVRSAPPKWVASAGMTTLTKFEAPETGVSNCVAGQACSDRESRRPAPETTRAATDAGRVGIRDAGIGTSRLTFVCTGCT